MRKKLKTKLYIHVQNWGMTSWVHPDSETAQDIYPTQAPDNVASSQHGANISPISSAGLLETQPRMVGIPLISGTEQHALVTGIIMTPGSSGAWHWQTVAKAVCAMSMEKDNVKKESLRIWKYIIWSNSTTILKRLCCMWDKGKILCGFDDILRVSKSQLKKLAGVASEVGNILSLGEVSPAISLFYILSLRGSPLNNTFIE